MFFQILHHDPPTFGDESEAEKSAPESLPTRIGQLSKFFPLAETSTSALDTQEAIERLLPTYERAYALAELYLKNLSWFFMPVDREQIMEELIPAAYPTDRRLGTAETPANNSTRMDPHNLALLLAILAWGAAADLSLPPLNDEGQLYFHCSRAALGLQDIFADTTIVTVQAISIIASCWVFSNNALCADGADKLYSFACMLALQVGQCFFRCAVSNFDCSSDYVCAH